MRVSLVGNETRRLGFFKLLRLFPPFAHEVFPPLHTCCMFFNARRILFKEGFCPFAVPPLGTNKVLELDSDAGLMVDDEVDRAIQFL